MNLEFKAFTLLEVEILKFIKTLPLYDEMQWDEMYKEISKNFSCDKVELKNALQALVSKGTLAKRNIAPDVYAFTVTDSGKITLEFV